MSEDQAGVEFYIKSPQGFEMAYRVSGALSVQDLDTLSQELQEAGFQRSERLDKPARGGGGNPNWKPREVPKNEKGEEVVCPRCEGPVWDNRPKKATGEYKPNSPDFACKNKECGGKIWPPKEGAPKVANGVPDENPFTDDPIRQFV